MIRVGFNKRGPFELIVEDGDESKTLDPASPDDLKQIYFYFSQAGVIEQLTKLRGQSSEAFLAIKMMSPDQQAVILSIDDVVFALAHAGKADAVAEQLERFSKERQVSILSAKGSAAALAHRGEAYTVMRYLRAFSQEQQESVLSIPGVATALVGGDQHEAMARLVKSWPQERVRQFVTTPGTLLDFDDVQGIVNLSFSNTNAQKCLIDLLEELLPIQSEEDQEELLEAFKTLSVEPSIHKQEGFNLLNWLEAAIQPPKRLAAKDYLKLLYPGIGNDKERLIVGYLFGVVTFELARHGAVPVAAFTFALAGVALTGRYRKNTQSNVDEAHLKAADFAVMTVGIGSVAGNEALQLLPHNHSHVWVKVLHGAFLAASLFYTACGTVASVEAIRSARKLAKLERTLTTPRR